MSAGYDDHTSMAARIRRVSESLRDSDRAVRIEVQGASCGDVVHLERANAILLALSSDFFEVALRDEWDTNGNRIVRLREVSVDDVRALVAHSEGRGVGWKGPASPEWTADIDAMLRIQGRFVMPQLRSACAATLREWSADVCVSATADAVSTEDVAAAGGGGSGWVGAAHTAAEHGLWDVVADAIVRASAPPWRSLGKLWSPGGIADKLLLADYGVDDGFDEVFDCDLEGTPRQDDGIAPEAIVADVLSRASFPYHGQRIAFATRWWTRRCAGDDTLPDTIPEGSPVVAALVETSARHPLWLPEVNGLALPIGIRMDNRLPPSVLVALVRALVRTQTASCPRPLRGIHKGDRQ